MRAPCRRRWPAGPAEEGGMTLAREKIAEAERVPMAVPARIAPLANLPVFHKIEGRKAVVAGGSQGALWKAELLSATGADVLVLAGHEAGAKLFAELAASAVAGEVTVLPRRWQASDLGGAALAIADIADRGEALRFVAARSDEHTSELQSLMRNSYAG